MFPFCTFCWVIWVGTDDDVEGWLGSKEGTAIASSLPVPSHFLTWRLFAYLLAHTVLHLGHINGWFVNVHLPLFSCFCKFHFDVNFLKHNGQGKSPSFSSDSISSSSSATFGESGRNFWWRGATFGEAAQLLVKSCATFGEISWLCASLCWHLFSWRFRLYLFENSLRQNLQHVLFSSSCTKPFSCTFKCLLRFHTYGLWYSQWGHWCIFWGDDNETMATLISREKYEKNARCTRRDFG